MIELLTKTDLTPITETIELLTISVTAMNKNITNAITALAELTTRVIELEKTPK